MAQTAQTPGAQLLQISSQLPQYGRAAAGRGRS
jgi:hypothetical protein